MGCRERVGTLPLLFLLSRIQGYAVGGSRGGPRSPPAPFVFPPPALVPKDLPEQVVGNHGNHPLLSESRQEKSREKAGKGQDGPASPFPFPMESPEIPRTHLDSGKSHLDGISSG